MNREVWIHDPEPDTFISPGSRSGLEKSSIRIRFVLRRWIQIQSIPGPDPKLWQNFYKSGLITFQKIDLTFQKPVSDFKKSVSHFKMIGDGHFRIFRMPKS